ncbi:MAG TPA: NosD domain-containing protein, partial [Candidatus Methylomirabilis sp.]|nr:NosD domain-containing protein [Candidatus Methylomirabilis sp.]
MALLILISINTTEAKTITVADIRGADYSRIQNAIDNAQSGDTILVQNGNYFENLSIDKSLIIKGLSVGEEKPLIYEKKRDTTVVILADNVTLDGFRITNSDRIRGKGILVLGKNSVIRNNSIWNNIIGIILRNSRNNTIFSNTVSNSVQSIIIEYSDNNLLSDNILSKNTGGIYLDFSSNNIIKS